MQCKGIQHSKNKEKVNWHVLIYDPRISRIKKILSNISSKFLDLYASIYGNQNFFYIFLQSVEFTGLPCHIMKLYFVL
jgi:hypothetical protein